MIRYIYENVTVRKRRGIPHWQVPFGLYFVTWRLAGSLKREEELRLSHLRRQLDIARLAGEASAHELEREVFRLLDRALDTSHGVAYLRQSLVADMVCAVLGKKNHETYDLIAYSVMPNHMHVVFRLRDQLDAVMQEWKSITAHRANRILERRGEFWADDYFDVLIRNSDQLSRVVRYVLANPGKAGLRDWKWVELDREVYAELI